MAPVTIFEILFIGTAIAGLIGHVAGRPWGVAVGFIGLIMFDLVLLIGGR